MYTLPLSLILFYYLWREPCSSAEACPTGRHWSCPKIDRRSRRG